MKGYSFSMFISNFSLIIQITELQSEMDREAKEHSESLERRSALLEEESERRINMIQEEGELKMKALEDQVKIISEERDRILEQAEGDLNY